MKSETKCENKKCGKRAFELYEVDTYEGMRWYCKDCAPARNKSRVPPSNVKPTVQYDPKHFRGLR